MEMYAIKIVGASGQGINTVGEILAKSLKRAGLSVVAYREYPSLIKGGHATYQIDFSTENISGIQQQVDCVMVLNRQRTNWHLAELKQSGIILHDIPGPRVNQEEAGQFRSKAINLTYIPALELAEEVGGNILMSNIVSLGYLWKLLKLETKIMEEVIAEKFASKPKLVEIDLDCFRQGHKYIAEKAPEFEKRLKQPGEIAENEARMLHIAGEAGAMNYFAVETDAEHSEKLLINGNEAISLGAISAGVRIHYAYPMTPASSILTYLADNAKETGMIVKQVEDEITAAAMALGSMHMGTRALTGTSGGGFDLMTEHLSFSGIAEIPMVVVLAQRPGPATGLPTWTAQGDLLLAINSAHGEFPRCVLTCSSAENAYTMIQEAFNIAEVYQIPVVLLTDKLIAETGYTIEKFDRDKISIERGIVDTGQDDITPTDRYNFSDNGISSRWLPGDSGQKTYNANSDEHEPDGAVTEESEMSRKMQEKRMRKMETLQAAIPTQPLYYNNVPLGSETKKLRLLGWGSTLTAVKDIMKHYEKDNVKVDYLDITHLWPLPIAQIEDYLNNSDAACIIEGNYTGQLEKLIRMETGISIPHHIRKYDGRPFYNEELISELDKIL